MEHHRRTGYMKKRAMSSALVKNWRRRWFVLDDHSLSYFKVQDGEKKGEVALDMYSEVTTNIDEWKKNHNSFIIKGADKELHCIAENKLSRDEWMEAINVAINDMKAAEYVHNEGASSRDSSAYALRHKLVRENSQKRKTELVHASSRLTDDLEYNDEHRDTLDAPGGGNGGGGGSVPAGASLAADGRVMATQQEGDEDGDSTHAAAPTPAPAPSPVKKQSSSPSLSGLFKKNKNSGGLAAQAAEEEAKAAAAWAEQEEALAKQEAAITEEQQIEAEAAAARKKRRKQEEDQLEVLRTSLAASRNSQNDHSTAEEDELANEDDANRITACCGGCTVM